MTEGLEGRVKISGNLRSSRTLEKLSRRQKLGNTKSMIGNTCNTEETQNEMVKAPLSGALIGTLEFRLQVRSTNDGEKEVRHALVAR